MGCVKFTGLQNDGLENDGVEPDPRLSLVEPHKLPLMLWI